MGLEYAFSKFETNEKAILLAEKDLVLKGSVYEIKPSGSGGFAPGSTS